MYMSKYGVVHVLKGPHLSCVVHSCGVLFPLDGFLRTWQYFLLLKAGIPMLVSSISTRKEFCPTNGFGGLLLYLIRE